MLITRPANPITDNKTVTGLIRRGEGTKEVDIDGEK
jgi:hypothetical protein